LAAVAQLDERWQTMEQGVAPHSVHQVVDLLPPVERSFDLIYAGGGLGVLHAAVMAQRYGYRVLLFDRGDVGCAHREWNIGTHELQALVDVGACTPADLDTIVMRRYHDGVVRFWADNSRIHPAELHLPHVLNIAVDAAALLRLARRKLEAAGGTVLDRRAFRQVLAQPDGGVVVEVEAPDGTRECYGARLLLDTMGATSPLALQRYAGRPFAGVCPTVGSVVRGLEAGPAPDQHHPDIGDILVSVADAQRNRQLIWEGFAGRDDELTVYVFYYDVVNVERSHHSLLDLFEDYFALLPTYKRPGSQFRHMRPVYGFIPARHTQRRDTRPPLLGTLPVGDSSAQQSPLTFCGFGSHVRNLGRTTSLLDLALRHDLLQPQHLRQISAYQANVALNWVFSRFMQPWRAPHDVNLLQNVFARVLNELGVDVAVRFFQDQMRWRDYGRIVNHTLKVYKRIIPTALTVLGPRDTARWVVDWLRFSGAAGVAAGGRRMGDGRLDRIEARLWAQRPAWAFALRARRAEWHAMGWNKERLNDEC
jgi:lycopene cyclase CruA